MDLTLKIWVVIVLVGALNYLSRLSFIAVFARRTMPPMLARALKYVPAAMLTALVLPMILTNSPADQPMAINPKVLAAGLAGIIAYFTRNTLYTIGGGMLALWLLQVALR